MTRGRRPAVWSALTATLALVSCGAAPAIQTYGEVWDPAEFAVAPAGDAQRLGVDTIILALHDRTPTPTDQHAAAAVRTRGLRLGYWLEVGRCESLATAQPDWQASLQGHAKWRRLFPASAAPGTDEVVKVWPWLPVSYAEAFDAHLARLRAQLAALPPADVVYLNNLQGPPSACGCGNTLCRWATDYTLGGRQPQRRATPLGDAAAAQFVAAVQALVPDQAVVPVWVTECEDEDTTADGACCGVGCYHGACWRAFDRQWSALRAVAPKTALLLPYREFGRDLPRFGEAGGWIAYAIQHLRNRADAQRQPIAGDSLVAVVQGYGDVIAPAEQRRLAEQAGVTATLVLRTRLDQTWRPQLVATPR